MVFITIELIRKRSEHNEGEIGTLEEISLHQEDIEKIEHLSQWCKHLKILLLQSNIISKIENLNKLKELEYLNLALNCIERIENLEGCESLQKLDLSVNFIGELTSIENLKNNIHLRELFLTGNPCCDYEDYRKYVVATLPQLEQLDCKQIAKSERIVALQEYEDVCRKIEKQQSYQSNKRAEQKERLKSWVKENEYLDPDDAQAVEKFWKSPSEYAPETRYISAKHKPKNERIFGGADKPKEPKHALTFFAPNGRPYNINQAKLPFKFNDDDPENFVLDLAVYRFLDTDLLNVDIEPNYVRVKIKEKYFQLALPDEVKIDRSTVIRSKTNGHLIITMPLLNPDPQKIEIFKKKIENDKREKWKERGEERVDEMERIQDKLSGKITKREYLEIGPVDSSMDFSQITKMNKSSFIDNPDVPPLE